MERQSIVKCRHLLSVEASALSTSSSSAVASSDAAADLAALLLFPRFSGSSDGVSQSRRGPSLTKHLLLETGPDASSRSFGAKTECILHALIVNLVNGSLVIMGGTTDGVIDMQTNDNDNQHH